MLLLINLFQITFHMNVFIDILNVWFYTDVLPNVHNFHTIHPPLWICDVSFSSGINRSYMKYILHYCRRGHILIVWNQFVSLNAFHENDSQRKKSNRT